MGILHLFNFCCYVTGTCTTFSLLTPNNKYMKPCVSCVVNIDLDKYFSVYFTGYISTIECMWHNILDTEVIVSTFKLSMCCEYAILLMCKRRTLVYSAIATVCNRVKSLGLTTFVYKLKQGTYISDSCWYCLWTVPWLNTSLLSF